MRKKTPVYREDVLSEDQNQYGDWQIACQILRNLPHMFESERTIHYLIHFFIRILKSARLAEARLGQTGTSGM